jgi:hypothetical protein
MDPKLFEVLGKYAGLAGLSIGLILVLFFTLLKLNIFPKLNTAQAYSLLKQLIYLTFTIGMVGIIAWVSINLKVQASSAVTGHIASTSTKAPVFDAEITVSGRSETGRSDSVGFFSLPFNSPLPTGLVRLYVAKDGYEPYNRLVGLGENIDAEIVPTAPLAHDHLPPPPESTTSTETYTSDNAASGSCADFGAWTTVCTPDKPQGWTIIDQNFQLTGDRAGCSWARCEPLGTISATKACYRFQTQGHSEECRPFTGNTGIHYSKGILRVVWQHPV